MQQETAWNVGTGAPSTVEQGDQTEAELETGSTTKQALLHVLGMK